MIRQQFDNFADFYPFYLSQHSNRTSRRLHFIGLILSLVVLTIVMVTASWFYLPITLVLGYGFAWSGHFFFEKNKPATFKYPLLSLLGDFTMAKDIICGKVKF
jgi:hypothetical protein